jgi:hypothetical protein
LFIGMVQGLVMQAMIGGKLDSVRACAPGAFAIYRRGIANSSAASAAADDPQGARKRAS